VAVATTAALRAGVFPNHLQEVKYMKSFTKLMTIPLILIFLISVVAATTSAQAQGACGTTYSVQTGDSLASIAQTCGVSYGSLLAANPQIKDPSLILPGQILNIPQVIIPNTGSTSTGSRNLQISPQEGPAGTVVTISGTNFPAYTNLTVGSGIVSAEPSNTLSVITDANGSFKVDLGIPRSALPLQNWIVFARQGSGNGKITVQVPFQVTSPNPTGEYVVQAGDTLSEIAAKYNTTLNALLLANPQITDPSLIYPGETIQIPGPVIVIPNTGAKVYLVQPGDYLSEIAQRYNTSVNTLLQLNPDITNPNLIYPGQQILLP
jgi:LysM repeat protein